MAEQIVTEVEYRDIPGHNGYKAGSDGTIWSCRKRGGNDHSAGRLGAKWRKRHPATHPNGHLQLQIDGKKIFVHVAVLLAFKGSPEVGQVCRHLNGNPQDNRIENLTWGTQKENVEDSIRHGVMPRGERVGLSKLKNEQIVEIRRRYTQGELQQSLANTFGVHNSVISRVCNRKAWAHV